MATNVSVFISFSDGTFTMLRDEISADATYEVSTDASGNLNITGDISVGQAYQGKTAVGAVCKVQTDSATTGAFAHGAFYGPDGSILCVIQGGGCKTSALPRLHKPVRMQTGVVCKVMWQAVSDAATNIGSLAVVCASGKADIFTGTGSDGANVSMTNKDGNTLGQALSGQVVSAAYATYPSTNGLADTGIAAADGIGAFFVEAADGTLKMMYPPAQASSSADGNVADFIAGSFRVDQNDTLTIRSNV